MPLYHPFMEVSVSSLGKCGPPSLSHWKEGGLGRHVHSCTVRLGRGCVGVMAQAGEWAGDRPLSPARRDALGKGPGNLSLQVASLIVNVLQSRGYLLLFCFLLFAEQLGIYEVAGGLLGDGAGFCKSLESRWLCGLPIDLCPHHTVSRTPVFVNCHEP